MILSAAIALWTAGIVATVLAYLRGKRGRARSIATQHRLFEPMAARLGMGDAPSVSNARLAGAKLSVRQEFRDADAPEIMLVAGLLVMIVLAVNTLHDPTWTGVLGRLVPTDVFLPLVVWAGSRASAVGELHLHMKLAIQAPGGFSFSSRKGASTPRWTPIRLGDPAFDDEVVVRGHPSSVLALLSAEVRSAMARLVARGVSGDEQTIEWQLDVDEHALDALEAMEPDLRTLIEALDRNGLDALHQRATTDPLRTVRWRALEELARSLPNDPRTTDAIERALIDDAGHHLAPRDALMSEHPDTRFAGLWTLDHKGGRVSAMPLARIDAPPDSYARVLRDRLMEAAREGMEDVAGGVSVAEGFSGELSLPSLDARGTLGLSSSPKDSA